MRLLHSLCLTALLLASPAPTIAQVPASLPTGTPAREINPRNNREIEWGLSAPAASKEKTDARATVKSNSQPTSRPTPKPRSQTPKSKTAAPAKLVFDNLSLRDEDGRIVYRGSIDLKPTLERISKNRQLSFRNDGSVFGNREGRLPRRGSGYYREWVVPTPEVRGPGPMRIVTGTDGEVFFTHDHYRTFQRIK